MIPPASQHPEKKSSFAFKSKSILSALLVAAMGCLAIPAVQNAKGQPLQPGAINFDGPAVDEYVPGAFMVWGNSSGYFCSYPNASDQVWVTVTYTDAAGNERTVSRMASVEYGSGAWWCEVRLGGCHGPGPYQELSITAELYSPNNALLADAVNEAVYYPWSY